MPAYSAAHFGFVLDPGNLSDRSAAGNSPALVRSIEGGFLEASVISEGVGAQLEQIKHIGSVDPQPFSVELGLASSKEMINWISETWQLKASKRSGRIDHGAPANGIIAGRFVQDYYDAMLTEVQFPALSAEGNDDAYMRVSILPGRIAMLRGDEAAISAPTASKQLRFTTVKYRLEIENTRILTKSIDGLVVKQHLAKLHTGRGRLPELVAAGLEIANFNVTCNESDADYFLDWYRDRLEKGTDESRADRSGSIIFEAQDGSSNDASTDIFTIDLGNVGIYSLQMEKSDADSTDFKKLKASLYAENAKLTVSPSFE